MAGQSVGLVTREQSTAEILGELVDQALAVAGGSAASAPATRRSRPGSHCRGARTSER